MEYIDRGWSLMPIGTNKRLNWEFIPKTDEGKFTWLPFQQERATHDTVTKWCASPRTTGLALVCGDISGGMRCIDFDDPKTFEAWGRLIGDRSELNGCLVQKTFKGYQVLHQSLKLGGNQVFAFAPDPDSKKGMRPIAETRENGGYCLLGGSLHPEGVYYTWLKNYNDLNALQFVPIEKQDRWDSLARSLNQVVEAKELITKVERTSPEMLSKAAIVMKEFSRQHPVTEYLERFGYHHPVHGVYVRPGGEKHSAATYERDGVLVSWHFNTSDSIFGESLYGKPHDGFDWFRMTECNGDIHKALELAAADVGIEWETSHQNIAVYVQPFEVIEGEGNSIILTDSPEVVSLMQENNLPVAIGPSQPWPRKYLSQLIKYTNRYVAFAGDEDDAQMVALEMEAKVMEFQGGLISFIRRNTINDFAIQLRHAYSVEM